MENADLPNRIADIFHGRTIFITGSTGFLGLALLETLLRTTEVKKIYLLIRDRKGKSSKERIHSIFSNPLFKVLLEIKRDAPKKCHLIKGDVSLMDLGISKEDREVLKEEVEFFFHSAATTRFDDTLKYTLTVNTRGTKYALELAEECKNLKLFIHMSTAYAFPKEAITYEKQYDPPANPHDVIRSLSWMDEDIMEGLTKKLSNENLNSYTFSKALSEALVYEKIGKIPLIICRPSLVVPTFRDPYPGWIDRLPGIMGVFVGGGKGVLRSVYLDGNNTANVVPVDCSVATTLTAAYAYLTTKNAPYIVNATVPKCDFSATWKEVIDVAMSLSKSEVPFNLILWYPGLTMTKSKIYYEINFVLFQLIPAIVVDAILFALGYKPFLYNIQKRLNKGFKLLALYSMKGWNFDTKNMEMIRLGMNAREKEVYFVQAHNIDIKAYFKHGIMTARRDFLKEADEDLPAARRMMKVMYVVDKLTKAIFFLILGYYFYSMMMSVFHKTQAT